MNTLNEKIILTDCDGVLVDWLYSFGRWMKEEHGISGVSPDEYDLGKAMGMSAPEAKKYVEAFNLSSAIGYMKPERDAIKYVRKLHEEHGYLFHVITSQTDDQLGQAYRKENLRNVFGDVFDGFTILKTGQNKDKVLMKWEGTECFWIEDKVSNIKMGNDAGLEGILISHNWNDDCHDERKVKTWKEIYNIITGE